MSLWYVHLWDKKAQKVLVSRSYEYRRQAIKEAQLLLVTYGTGQIEIDANAQVIVVYNERY